MTLIVILGNYLRMFRTFNVFFATHVTSLFMSYMFYSCPFFNNLFKNHLSIYYSFVLLDENFSALVMSTI